LRTPTVSVVIPVRDDAPALGDCLARLAVQTVAPLEVIVVDNASCDDSAAVARSRGARVVLEPSVGIPAAAATGYDEARGDVIARCDADSRPGVGWVATITRCMAADPDLAAVTGWGSFYDLPLVWRRVLTLAYLGSYYLLTHLALGHTALWGSSMAIRRSSWQETRDQVHRDDREIHDDMDLAFAVPGGREQTCCAVHEWREPSRLVVEERVEDLPHLGAQVHSASARTGGTCPVSAVTEGMRRWCPQPDAPNQVSRHREWVFLDVMLNRLGRSGKRALP